MPDINLPDEEELSNDDEKELSDDELSIIKNQKLSDEIVSEIEIAIKRYVDAYLEEKELSDPKLSQNLFSLIYGEIFPTWKKRSKRFKRTIIIPIFILAGSFFLVETGEAMEKGISYIIKFFQCIF